jgi:hypothetical protein
MAELQANGVPAGATFDSGDVFTDAHLKGRGMVQVVEHPVRGPVEILGNPIIVDHTPTVLEPDNSAISSGAAYVFVHNENGEWNQQAYLKGSNTEADDIFGGSVAISGNTIVIGAPGEASNATGVNGDEFDNSAPAAGAAYVFIRNENGEWSQQAYLKASNTETEDFFGSVAISGDTIVVGAMFEDSSATGINGDEDDNSASKAGAVYVFTRLNETWSQEAYIKASNTDIEDGFGRHLAITGHRVVIGAESEDSSATGINGDGNDNSAMHAGAAYIFVRDQKGIWSQEAYLKASNTDRLDSFGSSVTISGETVVIGAPAESSNSTGINGNEDDNSAFAAGAVYVFVYNGIEWSQEAYVKASNTFGSGNGGDSFGSAVAIVGNLIVVSAHNESSNATGINGDQNDNSAEHAGAAYVFVRNGTFWNQEAYLKASNSEANDNFGREIAMDHEMIVVGAWFEDSNATGINGNEDDNSAFNSGAIYVFDKREFFVFLPILIK